MGFIAKCAKVSILRLKWNSWWFWSPWLIKFYIVIRLWFWKSWASWLRKNKCKD